MTGESSTDARCVFIIDDTAEVRRGLERLVRSVRLNAESFDSAEAFLERAPYAGTGCVILDVRMPGMKGPELHEQLAQLEPLAGQARSDTRKPRNVQFGRIAERGIQHVAQVHELMAEKIAQHRVVRQSLQAQREQPGALASVIDVKLGALVVLAPRLADRQCVKLFAHEREFHEYIGERLLQVEILRVAPD